MAGSDEQDNIEFVLQNKEVKRCLEEAYEHARIDDIAETIQYLKDERLAENIKQIDTVIVELTEKGKKFYPYTSCVIYPFGD